MSYWNYPKKSPPKNFIFGFGSIVNDESRRSTVENAGDAIPVRISPDFGYRRVWNFQSPTAKLTALGLVKIDKAENLSTINGVIYPLIANGNVTEEEQMKAFDEREEGYVRMKVPSAMIEVTSWQCLPFHEYTVWIYIPLGQSDLKTGEKHAGINLLPPDKYYPILQSYVDVVLIGFLKYGQDFAMEFLYTTGWWSRYWLNDRQVPRRPWLFQKEYKKIDSLLKEYSERYGLKNFLNMPVNMFPMRKLPVEFSIYFAHEIHDEGLREHQEDSHDIQLVKSDANECTDLCFPIKSIDNPY